MRGSKYEYHGEEGSVEISNAYLPAPQLSYWDILPLPRSFLAPS